MKRMQVLASVVALSGLVFAAGCGSSSSVGEPSQPGQAQAQAQSDTARADLGRAHGMHAMKSPLEHVQQAVAGLALRPEQKTQIDQLFADAKASHEKAKTDGAAARKDLFGALATQVEAGKIDRTALEPKLAAAAAIHTQARAADAQAFDKLHAVLDAQQRSALVDALEKAHEDHMGHMGHMGHDHGPRGEGAGGEHKEMHGFHGGAHFGGQALNLTDDQKAKIHESMQKNAQLEDGKHAHVDLKAALESFRGESFSAATMQHPEMRDRAEGMVRFFEIATPILTPEQRATAAANLRSK